MYKLAVIALLVVAASCAPQADRYPAGVSPHLCPNYPHCDNALLAHHATGQHYAGAAPYSGPGAYDNGQYNPAHDNSGHYNHAQYNTGHYSAPAPYNAAAAAAPGYPAGVSPASCPNYPYCSHHASAVAAAPLPGFTSRQYPAGVSPHTHPNYPF